MNIKHWMDPVTSNVLQVNFLSLNKFVINAMTIVHFFVKDNVVKMNANSL